MSSKRSKVPITATQRLKQDYNRLKRDPVPFVTAEPLPSNILEWHYVVRGPDDTPYYGGFYHGKLVFPREFPFKPPSIYMITPSGRFKCNQRLCLSISDFHPDTWNPAWSVTTILTGLLSFMVEETPTLGSVETSVYTKQNLAKCSRLFNLKNETFCELFPDIVKEINKAIAEANHGRLPLDAQNESSTTNLTGGSDTPQTPDINRRQDPQEANRGLINLVILVGVAMFGLAVNNILKGAN
ncbi:ubiquitin-conjugating enzyme E2 J2-like [Clavelina lepadiformis]|uniref:UBC core domain-containing protein n=1 Tax=Clavelina lepadiformis TaxID=159417 RepID=A0ABP0GSH5_CLALP